MGADLEKTDTEQLDTTNIRVPLVIFQSLEHSYSELINPILETKHLAFKELSSSGILL